MEGSLVPEHVDPFGSEATASPPRRPRARRTIDAHSVGLLQLDDSGVCIAVNAAYARLTRRSVDDSLGSGWMEAIHPDDRELVHECLEAYFTHGTELLVNLRILHPDAAVHPARLSATPLLDASLEPTGHVLALVDLTRFEQWRADRQNAGRALREREQELEAYRTRLEELVEERTRELIEAHQELNAVTVVISRTVEARDPYTAGHLRRVAELASAIAERLELGEDDCGDIRVAAQLHDLGKVSIPLAILSKPGKLTAAEYALVQEHSSTAYEILQSVDLKHPIPEIVLQHHERLDGSGYPRGLAGDEILLGSRILAVADVVEAMSSHRPYRPAPGIDAALGEITARRGLLYDDAVVDACLDTFRAGFTFH